MKLRTIAAVLPLAAAIAFASAVRAQAPQEWPVAIEHAPGNASTCAPGSGDPMIEVADGVMSLRFASFPQPIWTVKLAPDGSFDAVVPSFADSNGARITVPAGTAPRPVATRQQSQPCGYRLAPR
ncbi:MAG: hypothetical protein EBY18_16485 [Alphaproteobacteria bacterium]|nr:hypothetical protein [Alphaproteobacteria bacterium]